MHPLEGEIYLSLKERLLEFTSKLLSGFTGLTRYKGTCFMGNLRVDLVHGNIFLANGNMFKEFIPFVQ